MNDILHLWWFVIQWAGIVILSTLTLVSCFAIIFPVLLLAGFDETDEFSVLFAMLIIGVLGLTIFGIPLYVLLVLHGWRPA